MLHLNERPDGALDLEAFQRHVLSGRRRFYRVHGQHVSGGIGVFQSEGLIPSENVTLAPYLFFRITKLFVKTYGKDKGSVESYEDHMSANDWNLTPNEVNDHFIFAHLHDALAYEYGTDVDSVVRAIDELDDTEQVVRWVHMLQQHDAFVRKFLFPDAEDAPSLSLYDDILRGFYDSQFEKDLENPHISKTEEPFTGKLPSENLEKAIRPYGPDDTYIAKADFSSLQNPFKQ